MTLWLKSGISECARTTIAKNSCVSIGILSQSPQSPSNPMNNPSLLLQVKTIVFQFGICLCKTNKKIQKYPTNWCSSTKANKKSRKSNSIQFTLKWLPAVQSIVSTSLSPIMSLQNKMKPRHMINRISKDSPSRNRTFLSFWEEWNSTDPNFYLNLYLNSIFATYFLLLKAPTST